MKNFNKTFRNSEGLHCVIIVAGQLSCSHDELVKHCSMKMYGEMEVWMLWRREKSLAPAGNRN
jgi:hypothetical protein